MPSLHYYIRINSESSLLPDRVRQFALINSFQFFYSYCGPLFFVEILETRACTYMRSRLLQERLVPLDKL
jgi:hypothetical protein